MRSTGTKMQSMSVTVDADLYAWIKEKAAEEKRTISGFVNYYMGKVMENTLRDEVEENDE